MGGCPPTQGQAVLRRGRPELVNTKPGNRHAPPVVEAAPHYQARPAALQESAGTRTPRRARGDRTRMAPSASSPEPAGVPDRRRFGPCVCPSHPKARRPAAVCGSLDGRRDRCLPSRPGQRTLPPHSTACVPGRHGPLAGGLRQRRRPPGLSMSSQTCSGGVVGDHGFPRGGGTVYAPITSTAAPGGAAADRQTHNGQPGFTSAPRRLDLSGGTHGELYRSFVFPANAPSPQPLTGWRLLVPPKTRSELVAAAAVDEVRFRQGHDEDCGPVRS